jgi:hypothetical protein
MVEVEGLDVRGLGVRGLTGSLLRNLLRDLLRDLLSGSPGNHERSSHLVVIRIQCFGAIVMKDGGAGAGAGCRCRCRILRICRSAKW